MGREKKFYYKGILKIGIRNREKERHEVKSNVGTIVGKENTEKSKAEEIPDEKLTQKAYYIATDQC